jgi:hypothetical protein
MSNRALIETFVNVCLEEVRAAQLADPRPPEDSPHRRAWGHREVWRVRYRDLLRSVLTATKEPSEETPPPPPGFERWLETRGN